MSDIDISAVNLNLLPALEALLATGSVSEAARRMHVSQSAMSHSLARLRELFDDPLWVPSGRSLVPTPRAEALRGPVGDALQGLRRVLRPPEAFDPAQAKRQFTLATFDYFELATMPDFLALLRRHAPGITVDVRRFSRESIDDLMAGEVHLAIVGGSAELPAAGLHRATLFADPFVVIAAADHPRVGRNLDLEQFLAEDHVLVSVEGRRKGAVDRVLEARGLRRRVALRVPHFLSAPIAVAHSELIATLASTIAARGQEFFGLQVVPLPLPIPPVDVVAHWPRQLDGDPGHRWFRDLFLRGEAMSRVIRDLMARRRGGG
jgi:DNA-binding transcriptional LysR family regulator